VKRISPVEAGTAGVVFIVDEWGRRSRRIKSIIILSLLAKTPKKHFFARQLALDCRRRGPFGRCYLAINCRICILLIGVDINFHTPLTSHALGPS